MQHKKEFSDKLFDVMAWCMFPLAQLMDKSKHRWVRFLAPFTIALTFPLIIIFGIPFMIAMVVSIAWESSAEDWLK